MNINKLSLLALGVVVGISVSKCINNKNKKIEQLSCKNQCYKCSYQLYNRCKK